MPPATLTREAALSDIRINGATLGTELTQLLDVDDIQPGDPPSYQICKAIFLYHPLGRKLVEAPIKLAQSQEREIRVAGAPEERLREAFLEEWNSMDADSLVFVTHRTARTYGVSALTVLAEGIDPGEPIPPEKLAGLTLSFNVFDPLNTAGSVTTNQDPNSPDFQKTTHVSVAGTVYHRSRSVVVMNEEPVYLSFTQSGFGFVGRSVYQRILFPLKSYLLTMVANDMIARKLALLVAKMTSPGSFVDRLIEGITAVKRNLLKEAVSGNVLSISVGEEIQTLDMTNVDGAGTFARANILKDIATGADMPAIIVENETMAAGWHEGSEDAKNIALFVDGMRKEMALTYAFLDKICMRRAWNPEFFEGMKETFPDLYAKMDYDQAFVTWSNSFSATWPSLLVEPDSEKAKAEDVKFKSAVAVKEALSPDLDPENKIKLLQWFEANVNSNETLFPTPLALDWDAMLDWTREQAKKAKEAQAQPPEEPGVNEDEPAPKPFAAAA